jgi:hypothetical protein
MNNLLGNYGKLPESARPAPKVKAEAEQYATLNQGGRAKMMLSMAPPSQRSNRGRPSKKNVTSSCIFWTRKVGPHKNPFIVHPESNAGCFHNMWSNPEWSWWYLQLKYEIYWKFLSYIQISLSLGHPRVTVARQSDLAPFTLGLNSSRSLFPLLSILPPAHIITNYL